MVVILVSDFKIVSHISGFFFLLLLRAVHEEIENRYHGSEHNKSGYGVYLAGSGSSICSGSFKIIVHFFLP